jgi:tRNA(Ile)-lysidine synthase
MLSLADRVRHTIRQHGLIPSGTRVLVALSGGPDSVALLTLLGMLAADDNFVVAGAAHLNHLLRGRDADEDEAFCRRLASSLSLPIEVEAIDVARIARQAHTSMENAAHDARYAFFARAARRLDAGRVAVGHTRDDQAETFLLRLIRGAGPRGLGGIHPRAGPIVRPLIECARADLRAFLQAGGIEFREDATNADVSILRNRVRHELIPFLRERFSPGLIAVLDREATIAREDAAFLDDAAVEAAQRLTVRTHEGIEIPAAALLAAPPAIARRVAREAQRAISRGRFVGFDAVESLLRFAASGASGPLDLPGHRAERRGETIVLSSSGPRGRDSRAAVRAFAYELSVPGRVMVPEAACAISAETAAVPAGAAAADLWPLTGRGDVAVLDAACVRGPLAVRSRRPGDVFRPLGLGGHKKLQDFFVDRKTRRAERDTVPLIVDRRGLIVWVSGHAVAEEARVTDSTEAVVVLRMRTLGGRG